MLRDILLPITGTAGDQAALDYATGLAAARDARLTLVVPIELPMPMPSPWGITPDPMLGELRRQLLGEAQARAQRLRQDLQHAPCTWDVVVDEPRFAEPPRAMAAHARTADLCIVPAPVRGADDQAVARAYFSAALFESGRPVLVVPTGQAAPSRFHRAAIAWQPTREAARATHDVLALELFDPQTAIDVAVVDVHAATYDAPLQVDGIVAHLARHGLSATTADLASDGQSAATRLLWHARTSHAQLLVAGGYGHSRLREWFVGGTTRDLLDGTHLPILFSH